MKASDQKLEIKVGAFVLIGVVFSVYAMLILGGK
jgi:hypothetical protein